jgi:hypothetical protein
VRACVLAYVHTIIFLIRSTINRQNVNEQYHTGKPTSRLKETSLNLILH